MSLVEILLALTIFAIASGAIFTLHFMNGNAIDNTLKQEQAYNYALEGLEIVKNIKQENFYTLTNGTYGLSLAGDTYSLVTDFSETVDLYSRTITIDDVYRDDANKIDLNGSNLDSIIKKITSTVSWVSQFGRSNSVVLQEYFSDWSGTIWLQTTQTQFNNGTSTDTIIVESDLTIPDNGAIELIEIPNQDVVYFDTVDVLERAQDVAVKDGNYLYAAVAKANQGFCSIDFTNPANPTVDDCLDIDGQGIALVIDDGYAYVLVQNQHKGLAVINISNPSNLQLVKTLDIDEAGINLTIQNNHLFIAGSEDDDALIIVNVSNPNSPFVVSSKSATGDGLAVIVDGNYAYLTTDNSKLIVYNISNLNSPSQITELALDADANGISQMGNYLYLATANNSKAVEVVSIADPANPFVVTSLAAVAGANDADILNGILYVSIDNNAAGLNVYSLNDPINPSLITTIDIQGKGQGLDADEGYVFIATDTQHQGIAMVATIALEVASVGSFVSTVHDTGLGSPNLQSLSWIGNTPSGTAIQFQLRTADSSENIETATFVGPDGTTATFYTATPSTITLDPNRSGEQFVQWQVQMTSDGNSSPALEEVTIKYE